MCGSWLRYCRSGVSCYLFPIVGSCASQAMTCAAISLSCGWLRCRGLHKEPLGVGANRPYGSVYLFIQATSNFPCQCKLRGASRPHHCCGTFRERRHALGGEEPIRTATETPQTGWTTFTTADVFCASRCIISAVTSMVHTLGEQVLLTFLRIHSSLYFFIPIHTGLFRFGRHAAN